MKKYSLSKKNTGLLVITGFMILTILLVTGPTGASADVNGVAGGGGAVNGVSAGNFGISNPLSGVNSVSDLVQTFAQIFTYLVVLVGVLALIYTGFQYIMAQGNSAKITELRKQLLWIVVGIAIVIGARIIINVVISTLSATGAVNQNIINNAQNAMGHQ